jgi:hypothetical protein
MRRRKPRISVWFLLFCGDSTDYGWGATIARRRRPPIASHSLIMITLPLRTYRATFIARTARGRAPICRPAPIWRDCEAVGSELARRRAAHPEIHLTNAEKRGGIAALRATRARLTE